MLPVSQPGNYFLAATDTVGCMQRDTISVFQNPLPQPDLGSDTTICFGDSVTLGAGAFASYQWQNGSTLPNFAANATGWYSVTVTDSNQCANTDSLYLTILPQVVAAFSFSDSAGYVSFTDQSLNAFSWNWDFGNGQSSTQQNPVTQFPPDSAFTVCLVVSDSLGCQDSSCMAILITNTPEPGSNELKLYPNPFRDEINYQYSGKERISSIKILDQMGRSVFSQQISQKRSTGNITTDHLPTGIYFIEIVAGAQRYIHKMVRIE